jgi:hypothetical protein
MSDVLEISRRSRCKTIAGGSFSMGCVVDTAAPNIMMYTSDMHLSSDIKSNGGLKMPKQFNYKDRRRPSSGM